MQTQIILALIPLLTSWQGAARTPAALLAAQAEQEGEAGEDEEAPPGTHAPRPAPVRPPAADAPKPIAPAKTSETAAPAENDTAPRTDDFFQFSDFVDSSLTFVLSNKNIFAGPGERLTPTSGYRIGVDPNFRLFLENINTRFTGYETLSHLVLYKKLPGFWENWETEAALAALVLANTDNGTFSFTDSGTYLRIIRKLGSGPEQKVGSVDLTAWPVSADRFRLGYTYIISWGGTAIFPGKLQTSSITEGAVPGIRARWRSPGGNDYAFLGFKSALLLEQRPGVTAGEQVPNYAVLAGAGTTVGDYLGLEMNGGFFQKGLQVRPGLETDHINAYGVAGRITFFQGINNREINDYRLYRNDPTDPVDYYVYHDYVPGFGFNIAFEGDLLFQNLEDPDRFGSEKLVSAQAAGIVAQMKSDQLYLTAYGFYQSIDFILFNVPGFVPFQAIPSGATTHPEFFFAAEAAYDMPELRLRPSLSAGIKIPATYKGVVQPDLGGVQGGAIPGEVRTQVILNDTTRVVLPAGTGATPVFGAVLKVPFALSRSMTIALEARLQLDDNQPRLAKDSDLNQATYFFDSPTQISLAAVLQSRW
jgi:hypothetical protein